MGCGYCFSTFQDLDRGTMPVDEAKQLIADLIANGSEKITYVGGEQLLYKPLIELMTFAKSLGATNMIVSNGSMMTNEWLEKARPVLDWITLSIDSIDEETLKKIGRSTNKDEVMTEGKLDDLIQTIRSLGFRLKINTVVSAYNLKEDLTPFIERHCPERWKLFHVRLVEGQNTSEQDRKGLVVLGNSAIDRFLISKEDYTRFVERHQRVRSLGIDLVDEDEDLMKGSHVMVDPQGRFFDAETDTHRYSDPILKVGLKNAFSQVFFSQLKFDKRRGCYDWISQVE
jgi:radical S-adenosyl methionine domain-containing protein 2